MLRRLVCSRRPVLQGAFASIAPLGYSACVQHAKLQPHPPSAALLATDSSTGLRAPGKSLVAPRCGSGSGGSGGGGGGGGGGSGSQRSLLKPKLNLLQKPSNLEKRAFPIYTNGLLELNQIVVYAGSPACIIQERALFSQAESRDQTILSRGFAIDYRRERGISRGSIRVRRLRVRRGFEEGRKRRWALQGPPWTGAMTEWKEAAAFPPGGQLIMPPIRPSMLTGADWFHRLPEGNGYAWIGRPSGMRGTNGGYLMKKMRGRKLRDRRYRSGKGEWNEEHFWERFLGLEDEGRNWERFLGLEDECLNVTWRCLWSMKITC
ncbi:hypothetical protein KM043_009258 [Ampulex compressa]|nr:hypothetical protein KM043_009258 [Ampulex compressa]